MKKRFTCAALSLSLLVSCTASGTQTPAPSLTPVSEETEVPAQAPSSTADAIARAILASQPDRPDYAAQTGEDLDLYLTGLYGLEDYIGMDAAVYAASNVDSREVAVVRLASMTSEGAAVTAALEEYRQNRLGDFFGYSPDQAALVEEGEVVSGWSCAALLICSDMDRAKAAFEEAAGQASVYVPPVQTAGAEESALPVGLSPADTRWFIPFVPPNEFDMTLYDTSAILAAWETGNESGLDDKDSLILERAKAVLEECDIREGMSGYQKELLLHDWFIENVSYDQSAYIPGTPMGMPDSGNPYGPLVNGCGICLGYAAAFQLLMDMAGVACITVVGASNESRQDHAWNMVKLAEEWYCVDVTWDDCAVSDPDAYTREELEQLHHEYFNVTSHFMRASNHQWDYQNVPEATAEDHGQGAMYPQEAE